LAAGLTTFLGTVDGLDTIALPKELGRFDCRNNRLAKLGLDTDGFREAVARASERYGDRRVAVVVGTTTSGIAEGERAFRHRNPDTGRLPDWFDFDHTHDFSSLAKFVAQYLELRGLQHTVSAACASSTKVFADAVQLINVGLCDAVVVGGVDSICDMTVRGFHSLELLAETPCKPFDVQRAGLSIGEAAGFALIEKADRVANPEVLLAGYGESSDAHHISAPHPEGLGAVRAMAAALSRAGLDPEQIDYINLHGTGTRANDAAENKAVITMFGTKTPTSSTKGWTGHGLGAAGITEAVIACLCVAENFAPKSLKLLNPDPDFSLNVLTANLDQPIRHVLSNSFGFGGANACVILSSPE
jgi:3-oxoacyl-[acyl-carrier-protein] synthase-1